jgi:hypothetical protein
MATQPAEAGLPISTKTEKTGWQSPVRPKIIFRAKAEKGLIL